MKKIKRVPVYEVGQKVWHRVHKKEGVIQRIVFVETIDGKIPMYVVKIEFWTCKAEERHLEALKQEPVEVS
jgi:hypothetical protein